MHSLPDFGEPLDGPKVRLKVEVHVARTNSQGALTVGAAVALVTVGLAGAAILTHRPARRHPPDDAPGRTARHGAFGDYEVAGHAVTIDRARRELYEFWRDFQNLATFMENIEHVQPTGEDRAVWTIKAPAGQTVDVETRIVKDIPDELIAWRSVAGSDIDTEGRVTFRDAGARGTIVEAIIAYKPPAGALGMWIAKLFQREPTTQGRQELKRFKMLMETGEIAIAKTEDRE
jgi:uncharacterized membrane protein